MPEEQKKRSIQAMIFLLGLCAGLSIGVVAGQRKAKPSQSSQIIQPIVTEPFTDNHQEVHLKPPNSQSEFRIITTKSPARVFIIYFNTQWTNSPICLARNASDFTMTLDVATERTFAVIISRDIDIAPNSIIEGSCRGVN